MTCWYHVPIIVLWPDTCVFNCHAVPDMSCGFRCVMPIVLGLRHAFRAVMLYLYVMLWFCCYAIFTLSKCSLARHNKLAVQRMFIFNLRDGAHLCPTSIRRPPGAISLSGILVRWPVPGKCARARAISVVVVVVCLFYETSTL